MVSGFTAIQGLFTDNSIGVFGNPYIIGVLLLVLVIALLAYIGASFELNFAIVAILALGLAFTGFWLPLDATRGIIMLFTALIMAFFFTRILGG